MTTSDTLTEWFLGLTEAVAAFGDHLGTEQGDRLAEAAREIVDRYWDENGEYPAGARECRDQFFAMLMITHPSPVH